MPRLHPLVLLTLASIAIWCLLIAGTLIATSHAQPLERPAQVQPVPAPDALVKARAACPGTTTIVECRGRMVRLYEALAWQRAQNLALAREMLGNVGDWTCIHRGEGAWNDAGDPYWGGLQFDRGFMRTYGPDMIRRHHGGLANTWTPREQIIVAERARASGRGYQPWPNTGRACGLL